MYISNYSNVILKYFQFILLVMKVTTDFNI